MRYRLAQTIFAEALKRRDSIDLIQSNLRAFMHLKDWEWMKIIFKIKPLISQVFTLNELSESLKQYCNFFVPSVMLFDMKQNFQSRRLFLYHA